MHPEPSAGHRTLDAWREQGADRLDPLAFAFMAAVHRRLAAHQGPTREALERRLNGLIAAYAQRLAAAPARADGGTEPAAAANPPGALGGLLAQLADHAATREGVTGGDAPLADTRTALVDLPALGDFRKLWTEVRNDSQMRRSVTDTPTHAGPLNSASLVHRALGLMRELSPGYLQQFLAYVDVLAWLEPMKQVAAPAAKPATAPRARKPRVRKPRAAASATPDQE